MSITAEERLKWWHKARFGMFIHWGLYASPAGEWKGEKIPGIGEWIMRNAKIPIEEYEQLAKAFNPVKFDAEEWAEIAHQAGMKYLVITAKHHDGFCMFDSPTNPYNIVAQTPFKRDPLKELADACNKRGIRMCFYYSQAQDWHAPGGAGHWDEQGDGPQWLSYARPAEDFQKYLDEVVKPDLKTLLTNYGPIGLIWFDTPVAINKVQSESLRDLVHELQPECLVSGRVGHDVGDYGSLGDNEHPKGRVQGAWETPATLNDTWGYKTDDHNWKSLEFLLELLVNCASKGVNYLLNVGPTAEGVIPKPSVDLLAQVGDWLKRNGDAIYGTQASPFPVDPDWGRMTTKGNKLYLMIKEWSTEPISLYGLCNTVVSAEVLGAADMSVSVEQDGDQTTVHLPSEAPESIVSVVALTLDGETKVETTIIQTADAAIELPVTAAALEGDAAVTPQGYTKEWTQPGAKLTWSARVKTPGPYTIKACARVHRKLLDKYGERKFVVTLGGQSFEGVMDGSSLDQSDGAKVFPIEEVVLGPVTIDEAGDYQLTFEATALDPQAERGMTLGSVMLVPASQA